RKPRALLQLSLLPFYRLWMSQRRRSLALAGAARPQPAHRQMPGVSALFASNVVNTACRYAAEELGFACGATPGRCGCVGLVSVLLLLSPGNLFQACG